jgi:hypothetical protein
MSRGIDRTIQWIFLTSVLLCGISQAGEIVGVQPAALDQPRIFINVYRNTSAAPLSAKVEKESQSAIEAFLDTGASNVALSEATYQALGLKKAMVGSGKGAREVEYEDVGVGGSEKFSVSEPLLLSFASYSSNTDGDNPGAYSKPAGPVRVNLRPADGILDMLTGGTDVAGMPMMSDKVMVIDPKPLNTFADKLRTSIVAENDKSIPKVTVHVPLTYVSFDRFTRTTPGGGTTTAANPLIGPDPFKSGDSQRPVTMQFHGKSGAMTMLLDTGAVCSMISRKQAAALGVTYSADEKKLLGAPEKEQFSLTVGGIGGSKSAVGFYLDQLTLPADKGEEAIVYGKAPVLVNDITVVDPKTQQSFTLDGVFGMNFLVASANITGGLLPDLDKMTEGPFTMIVIDHQRHFLGLMPRE